MLQSLKDLEKPSLLKATLDKAQHLIYVSICAIVLEESDGLSSFLELLEPLVASPYDAWLLLWPILSLEGKEDLVLSLNWGLVDNDDEDEGEQEGDGLILFFFLLEFLLLLPTSWWGEGKDDLFHLGGLGLLFTLLLLGATSLSKGEEESLPPSFLEESW